MLIHLGLHFNPEAYKLQYQALIDIIKERWPDQVASCPRYTPHVVQIPTQV